jgi:trehalose-6-phosphate synthase/Kef-type K+ transport system membrane component KefB
MTRLAGAALVTLVLLWVQRLAAPGAPATALALGFTLIVAMVAGEGLRRFRLPRLTGYLLFGVVIGPHLGNVITESMAGELRAVNGLATTIIAFVAGLSLNFERLTLRTWRTGRLIATMLCVTMGSLFVLAWLAWPWLPVAPDASGAGKLAMVALFVVIVISFSPTMSAAVISETGARGRLSDLVLAIVVVADVVALLLFSLFLQLARATLEGPAGDVSVMARLAWEIGGAVAFGCLVGALFALYLRYVGREVTLVLLAVCVVLGQVGFTQGLEPLLAAMAAGIVMQNVAEPQGDALKVAIQRGALPVLVVFFAATGASLDLNALAGLWLVAPVLVVLRVVLIRAGISAGVWSSGIDPAVGAYAWTGLISQAGITLGLASILATEFPTWGSRVQALLIALTAIDELVGPALFRFGLARAGEIDNVTARPLLVVSNREPYLHQYDRDGRVQVTTATGGVAVALDALMRERHGVWIAYADGSADREAADAKGRVAVPPDKPSYTLRRLWLDAPTYDAYYAGFANEGLWPLCHLVDVRPQFRRDDWAAYQDVNARFAEAIDEELGTEHPDTPVFIQDYHLALVAARLRERRPLVRTALFWHIPWPYPDRFRICPWRRELLAGLLANDLVAFQVERDRRNFVLAVEEEFGPEVESDDQRIWLDGHVCTVTAVPIGVDYDRIQGVAAAPALAAEQQRLRDEFGLDAPIIGLGVDRLDYTKGIPERLEALDRLFARRPDLAGRLTFVQVGVPSRSSLDSYSAIEAEIDRKVAEVNARHARPGQPPPIHYHKAALPLHSLVALYRLAQFCVVSSLHDGMNLVAKEFVASRDDEDGVLILSALAGAAQELNDALVINPYDVDAFSAAMAAAVDMPAGERRARMAAMRRVVAGRDVFRWASDILEGLESLWSKPLQYAARAPEDAPV